MLIKYKYKTVLLPTKKHKDIGCDAKGYLSGCERLPFTNQEATFWNAKDGLL